MSQSGKRQGVVKFYNETKGFGFIVASDTSEEIFVHISGLEDHIDKGDEVEFETVDGQKGISAVKVKRTN
jgi:CspA family cold shock protein